VYRWSKARGFELIAGGATSGFVNGIRGNARFGTAVYTMMFTSRDPNTLFVLDTVNKAIRAVDVTTGNVSTFVSGFDWPVGMTIDETYNKIIVAEFIKGEIYEIDPVTRSKDMMQIYGLNRPASIVADSSGYRGLVLYIANIGDNTIRKWYQNGGPNGGNMETIAGTGVKGNGPNVATAATQVALDLSSFGTAGGSLTLVPQGSGAITLYFCANEKIRKIYFQTNTSSGTMETFVAFNGITAKYDVPQSTYLSTIAYDSKTGNIYMGQKITILRYPECNLITGLDE